MGAIRSVWDVALDPLVAVAVGVSEGTPAVAPAPAGLLGAIGAQVPTVCHAAPSTLNDPVKLAEVREMRTVIKWRDVPFEAVCVKHGDV